jgi:hypothetical protein
MDKRTCLRCQSSTLILDGLVFDQGLHSDGILAVGFQGDPKAVLFKGQTSGAAAAVICVRCGFVELHAANPALLGAAYRAALVGRIEKARKAGVRPQINSCPICVTVLMTDLACDACGWTFDAGDDDGGTA